MSKIGVVIVIGALQPIAAAEALHAQGFDGPVIFAEGKVPQVPGSLREMPAGQELLKDADVVLVVGADALLCSDPAPLVDAVLRGPDKVHVLHSKGTMGRFAARIGLTEAEGRAVQEQPYLLTDVIAYKPGPGPEGFLDAWAKLCELEPTEDAEILFNRLAARSLPQVGRLPGGEAFDGFRHYGGPFVCFRGREDKALEWLAGRATKAVPAEVSLSGELAVSKEDAPAKKPRRRAEASEA